MASNFSAAIPVASMAAANAALNDAGFGPSNFSVPAFDGPSPGFALLHAWGNQAFEDAVAVIPDVVVVIGEDPIAMTTDVATICDATWGQDALPLVGNVTPGLYKDELGILWWVIQPYDTAVYPFPELIPALVRSAKVPGSVLPWQQPIDQYDAYKLVNTFTGQPDRCTHDGSEWQVTQADGAGNNVWEPGVFGWEVVNAGSQ